MSSPAILELFGLAAPAAGRCVALVGGGGKTTLLFALAAAAAAAGRRVITTTTTRILAPGPAESPRLVLGSGGELEPRVRAALAEVPHVTAAAALDGGSGKLLGLAPGDVDRLVAAGLAAHVLVEADGSAGRPLKAHRAGEPVVPAATDLAIAVVGAGCLGVPLDEAHVHRAPLLAERLARPAGSIVRAEDVAGILFHAGGYLARVGEGVPTILFVATPSAADQAAAGSIVRAVRERDVAGRIGAIVVGDVGSGLRVA